MLKKLIVVGGFTGIAHLLTLLSLKFLSKNISEDNISIVGEIDALLLLLISIVSFGVQLSATREIAVSEDWKEKYSYYQSARVAISLIICVFSITGIYESKYWLLAFAPILALNGDFALYGRNMPIQGAYIAFIRIIIPVFTLITFSFFYKNIIIYAYLISILLSYLIAGLLTTRALKVRYIIKPKFQNLKIFYKDFGIGISSVALLFLGVGIINLISPFYDSISIGIAYMALKIYMIFKGVKRIIVQSFFKEISKTAFALKIDFLSTVASMILLFANIIFPKTFIRLLFSNTYITNMQIFIILSISAYASSFTTSTGTRLLLQKNDKQYIKNILIASAITIISAISFSYAFKNDEMYIGVSILLGEIVLALMNIKSIAEKNYLQSRIKQILMPTIIILLISVFRIWIEDNILTLLISIILFCLSLLLTSKKELSIQ